MCYKPHSGLGTIFVVITTTFSAYTYTHSAHAQNVKCTWHSLLPVQCTHSCHSHSSSRSSNMAGPKWSTLGVANECTKCYRQFRVQTLRLDPPTTSNKAFCCVVHDRSAGLWRGQVQGPRWSWPGGCHRGTLFVRLPKPHVWSK